MMMGVSLRRSLARRASQQGGRHGLPGVFGGQRVPRQDGRRQLGAFYGLTSSVTDDRDLW
jgi:hypothetical protein